MRAEVTRSDYLITGLKFLGCVVANRDFAGSLKIVGTDDGRIARNSTNREKYFFGRFYVITTSVGDKIHVYYSVDCRIKILILFIVCHSFSR